MAPPSVRPPCEECFVPVAPLLTMWQCDMLPGVIHGRDFLGLDDQHCTVVYGMGSATSATSDVSGHGQASPEVI